MQKTISEVKLIRQRIKVSQDHQKSYYDQKHKEVMFEVGDKVFLKVTPMKGVKRFGKCGKLSPRFIGPFEILEKVGKVAYRLALPPALSKVHNVFHISMLRRYIVDLSHILDYKQVELDSDLASEEPPERILERRMIKLRRHCIPMVKVQWQGHPPEEATWEHELDVRSQYPGLNFEDEILLRGKIVMTRKLQVSRFDFNCHYCYLDNKIMI